ncbi:MAG TPA: YhjD/YihY/BrkB family envelope integrity protein [Candidatus Polarisedimenticolaceae bacterium]|nr:YhjD/YihY/BrkB family envelope integrity protein [Candidatus Polarisedimenticolaceae bacterium]
MEGAVQQITHGIDRIVWERDLRELTGWRWLALRAARLVYVVIRDLLTGEINLRAMSLVYTTLLSIVPLLAVSFSVLKVFGVHNQVAPLLRDFLRPLGDEGVELADDIVAFVENVQVGVLGALGVVLLIYTAISLMHKIEVALNFVWHVDGVRSLGRRVSSFISVVLVGPVLVVAALGITASLRSTTVVRSIERIEPFGSLLERLSQWLPYLLGALAFTLVYALVPNTRVKLRAAATGGVVAGILWQSVGLFFATFIASSARYAAIYSSFAVMIVTLIWLYANWLILLIGSQIAFYVQNPHYLTRKPLRLDLSNRMKETLSLAVIYWIGANHVNHVAPHTVESLADRLELPTGPVEQVLALLEQGGWVEKSAADPPGYLPARDLATIRLDELLGAVRTAGETPLLNVGRVSVPEPVRRLAAEAIGAAEHRLGERTVRDICTDSRPAGVADGQPADG